MLIQKPYKQHFNIRLLLSICLTICLSLFLYVTLSYHLSLFLSVSLPHDLSLFLSVSLSHHLSLFLFVTLSLHLSLFLFVTLSHYLSLFLPVSLVSLSVSLSVCLSPSPNENISFQVLVGLSCPPVTHKSKPTAGENGLNWKFSSQPTTPTNYPTPTKPPHKWTCSPPQKEGGGGGYNIHLWLKIREERSQ